MDTSHKPVAHKEEKPVANEHTICRDMKIKPIFHLSNWTWEKLIVRSQGRGCFMYSSVKTDTVHLEVNLAKIVTFSMIHFYEFMPGKHSVYTKIYVKCYS